MNGLGWRVLVAAFIVGVSSAVASEVVGRIADRYWGPRA